MDNTLHVLLLEDRPTDGELVLRELRKEGIRFQSIRVETEADFRMQLGAFRPGLILADYSLPTYDGLSALAMARETCPEVPFILVSGAMGEDLAVESLQHGATDFILKQRLDRLGAAVRRALREVTERNDHRRAEQAVARLSQQRELILNSAAEGILGLDTQGNHTFVNPAAARMLGYEAGELLGRPTHATWHHTRPDGRRYPPEECQICSAYRDGRVHRVTDEVFWRKDGTSFPVEYSSTPIYEQERLTGAVVTFEDITERRLLEQQYQQAQKMEAIGRLAGGVAHDFNNLLTAILGYCELLLDELEPTDPRRRDITEIRKAGSRAAELTRQLLAISRKQIIEPKRLDLNAIIVEIRPMLGRVIGEDVIVVLDLSPQLGAVTADHGQVEQVILNLAVNARDAMPNGGTVTIKTADVDINELDAGNVAGVKPGRYVMLAVTDTGTGMTPEVQARVFEPFFTTKPVGQGTGLGLASVYGIVTGAGGAVRVRSAVGKGSSFELLFPLLEGAEAVVKAPPTMLPPRAEGETVLVVDDADGARELIARLLQRQGYAVLVAESPEEAIRLFDANASVDVLLTDVIMPGMSGAALARQLVARRPELKVIYMSGYTDDAVVHHDVLKPGTAFLNKPFDSAALAKKIREVLDR